MEHRGKKPGWCLSYICHILEKLLPNMWKEIAVEMLGKYAALPKFTPWGQMRRVLLEKHRTSIGKLLWGAESRRTGRTFFACKQQTVSTPARAITSKQSAFFLEVRQKKKKKNRAGNSYEMHNLCNSLHFAMQWRQSGLNKTLLSTSSYLETVRDFTLLYIVMIYITH